MGLLKKYSVFLLAVLLLASCMTEKKWAEGCAEKYPVKESVATVKGEIRYDTAYLQPDTLVFTDTVTVDCDTVKGVVTKYVYKEKPCPPAQVRTVSRVDTVVITKLDRAALAASELDSQEQRQRADRVTSGRDTWRWISLVCFLVIGTAIFSKIKGFI